MLNKFKDKIFQFEFRAESHCDECGVVHNNFPCPVCGKGNAGTTMAMEIYDEIEKVGDSFECEECETKFELVDMVGGKYNAYAGEWKWKVVFTKAKDKDAE